MFICIALPLRDSETCDCQTREGVEGSMFTGVHDVLEKLLIAKATHFILSLLVRITRGLTFSFGKTALLLESFLATSNLYQLEKKMQERLTL